MIRGIGSTNTNIPNMQTVTVKKEPEELSSTSHQEQTQQIHIQQQPQTQTIAVSVAPPHSSTHTIETSNTSTSHQPQHIVTHHDNSDGSTSLQIAQVQNLPTTHQLTLSNLNQVKLNEITHKVCVFVDVCFH